MSNDVLMLVAALALFLGGLAVGFLLAVDDNEDRKEIALKAYRKGRKDQAAFDRAWETDPWGGDR